MGMTKKSIAAFYQLPKHTNQLNINHVMVGPLGVLMPLMGVFVPARPLSQSQ